jgi:hypothetical protein
MSGGIQSEFCCLNITISPCFMRQQGGIGMVDCDLPP